MKWELEKTITVSASHELEKVGECSNLHGHNWKITVKCSSRTLNKNYMVVDFNDIKKIVMKYDHTHINDLSPFCCGILPTAEKIAEELCLEIPLCDSVTVEESENNKVIYYR